MEGGILYALVVNSNDSSVFADFTRVKGNHAANAKRILSQTGSSAADSKRSFVHQKYCYSILNDGTLTYVAVTDESFSRTVAFNFLAALRKGAPAVRGNPSGMSALLKKEAAFYSDPKNDKITKIKLDISEVKDTMIDNIDKIITRGEKIDGLVDKTQILSAESRTFETGARDLRYKMLKKRIIIIIVVGVILLVLAFIIMLIACSKGGINFEKCFSKSEAPPPSATTLAPSTTAPTTTVKPPPTTTVTPPAPPIFA